MLQDQIFRAVRRAVLAFDTDSSGLLDFSLDTPKDLSHGDLSTNAAILLARKQSKIPVNLANELVNKLNVDQEISNLVDKIEVAEPGFINFYLSSKYLSQEILKITYDKDKYATTAVDESKKVIVEYSSPNIAKPFTIGHLRSTIIGDAVANLLQATGWKVYRDNHLGDWGTQFGKLVYAIKTWGNEEAIEKSDRPVKILVDLYVKFHQEAESNPKLEDYGRQWFAKLENKDHEARRLWKKCVDWSWIEFNKIYNELGIKFSPEFDNGRGLGESFFEDKMKPVIEDLEKLGLLRVGQDGAKLVFFPQDEYPPLMIIKKDGATLYSTRDLATDLYRMNTFVGDLVIINEVGAEQSLYFKQIFKTEEMLGWFRPGQRIHIKHGHFRFSDSKMSTRKGNVIWLEDVINKASEEANKLSDGNTEVAKKVAIGALKWNELKRDPLSDVIFDWKEILNMQGNSGPYVQYTFARTQSVLGKSSNSESSLLRGPHKGVTSRSDVAGLNFDFGLEEMTLVRKLARYQGILVNAAKLYSPSVLAEYLYDLSREFNSFYNANKILGSGNEKTRLLVTAAVGLVLKNGLNLLGVDTPERM